MSIAAIPSTLFLSPKEITVGEFTTDLAAAHQEHWVPKVPGDAPSIEREFKFGNLKYDRTQTKFSAALCDSVSARICGQSASTCAITADRGKRYMLQHVTTWFKNAMESDGTKLWIQRQAASNQNIYMITGMHTIIDPRIELDFTSTKQREFALRLPLELPPNFKILQPATEGGRQREAGNKLEYTSSGEHIFALEYRKVTFKWLRRLFSKPPQLSPSCAWTCLDTPWRGVDNQGDDMSDSSGDDTSDDEGENVIEVTVEMESTLPDENWAAESTENGHYCISTIA
ncbi:hypothetical protein NLG97_g644 [Lecanicillium saksenae]|uniref:Uncharacterized protein n=1 Tax=Lecanicillium saksenae TaxID=468837 RepID=A0ACC1R7G4_9HYPO|nr:hypothetical protein NLG97_g644 [Lecanicillium saksenae]